MGSNNDDLLREIHTLWINFNNCKAHFPYMQIEAKGAKEVRTAPYYIEQGFDIKFIFSKGITENGINKINAIGLWINQNAIIRLCAILESFHIISKDIAIDFALDGAEHVNIVRRLRNYFVHSSGKLRAGDKEHRKTLKLMKDTIKVSINGCTDWPLSISTIIQPLFEGCIKYVNEKERKGQQI
jgi:hypothetical protein